MDTDSDTILWSIQEAAERSSVSRSTLYRLMGNGELPFVKIGTRRLISNSALRALIEANSVAVPS